MKPTIWTHLLASVCGGLVVAGILVAIGVTRDNTTRTTPDNSSPAGNQVGPITQQTSLDALYRHYAPGVVKVKAIIDHGPKSVVGQHSGAASQAAPAVNTGSGFLVDYQKAEYILTSYHLVAGADATRGITVQFAAGVSERASLLRYDVPQDVAVLKADAPVSASVTPLSLGESKGVQPGDSVIALAYPLLGVQRTIKSGIVSSLQAQLQSGAGTVAGMIQTDLPVNKADSGGPLLDSDGFVIGVMSTRGGSAFASPIDNATALLAALPAATH